MRSLNQQRRQELQTMIVKSASDAEQRRRDREYFLGAPLPRRAVLMQNGLALLVRTKTHRPVPGARLVSAYIADESLRH